MVPGPRNKVCQYQGTRTWVDGLKIIFLNCVSPSNKASPQICFLSCFLPILTWLRLFSVNRALKTTVVAGTGSSSSSEIDRESRARHPPASVGEVHDAVEVVGVTTVDPESAADDSLVSSY